jgi:hypothetical protein
MVDKKKDTGYNSYTEDGLPDLDGCMKFIEGFWRILQLDLSIGDMEARAWVEGECPPEICETPPCGGFSFWVGLTTKQMSADDIRDFLLEEFWGKPQNIPKGSKRKKSGPVGRPMGKR